MNSRVLLQILFLLIAASLILFYLRYIERRTIFYPTKDVELSPSYVGLNYEDIFFESPDSIELNGWFLSAPMSRFTVLLCHGNAGNISHRIEKLKFFHELGCNVFIFDYRGYGKSKGSPSENGLYSDAQGAYYYLLSRKINPEQIIGYGESIGGAVIIDLAAKQKLAALIIDSSLTNAKDMVKVAYPFLPYWIFVSRWDSTSKVKPITIPKLFIHSMNDEIVPYKLGRKLFEAASEPKEFLQIHGGHNSCFFESDEILKEKISSFLKKLNP